MQQKVAARTKPRWVKRYRMKLMCPDQQLEDDKWPTAWHQDTTNILQQYFPTTKRFTFVKTKIQGEAVYRAQERAEADKTKIIEVGEEQKFAKTWRYIQSPSLLTFLASSTFLIPLLSHNTLFKPVLARTSISLDHCVWHIFHYVIFCCVKFVNFFSLKLFYVEDNFDLWKTCLRKVTKS